ncbi:MAG: 1-deoxy-D-xylulose-5-phosphate reductoisomerase [Terriglobales bacterium]
MSPSSRSSRRRLALLGATGSIGENVLKVVDELPGRFELTALTAGANIPLLARLASRYRPGHVALADAAREPELREALRAADVSPQVHVGPEALAVIAGQTDYDVLVLATVGIAALPACWAAVERGATIALANKEVLVVAGELLMPRARAGGATILPVDSEHSALHQCLRSGRGEEIERLILTASGGAFRDRPLAELARVTPAEALRHPTWRMGRRVTVDAATLMNKGFEVIEACHLFAVAPERVEVVLHPQSIVHSLVEFRDGSVLAQMGTADMRTPIQYALTFPERVHAARQRLDLSAVEHLDFRPPDFARYPCLRLAREALASGGTAPAVLNAADEVAVEAFCAGRTGFLDIARAVERTLERAARREAGSLEDILAADGEARRLAREALALPAAPAQAWAGGKVTA